MPDIAGMRAEFDDSMLRDLGIVNTREFVYSQLGSVFDDAYRSKHLKTYCGRKRALIAYVQLACKIRPCSSPLWVV